MSRCTGCGGELMTVGCVNPTCGNSMGGTYINGVKTHTASGRRLVPDPRAAEVRRMIDAMSDDAIIALWDKLRMMVP